MTDEQAADVWKRIITILEDQLQYGFLQQIKSVVDVKLSGSELHLCVASHEARDFFTAEVNQQRLMILSRSVTSLKKISVERVEAEPFPRR